MKKSSSSWSKSKSSLPVTSDNHHHRDATRPIRASVARLYETDSSATPTPHPPPLKPGVFKRASPSSTEIHPSHRDRYTGRRRQSPSPELTTPRRGSYLFFFLLIGQPTPLCTPTQSLTQTQTPLTSTHPRNPLQNPTEGNPPPKPDQNPLPASPSKISPGSPSCQQWLTRAPRSPSRSQSLSGKGSST